MTVDLSRTIAITADGDSFNNYGAIKFVSGPLSGQQFQIKADGDYIGRDGGSAQIVIGDPRISKRHLWIGVKGGRVVITDQNSRNGTFVNGRRLTSGQAHHLHDGESVRIGTSEFRIMIATVAAAAAMPASGGKVAVAPAGDERPR